MVARPSPAEDVMSATSLILLSFVDREVRMLCAVQGESEAVDGITTPRTVAAELSTTTINSQAGGTKIVRAYQPTAHTVHS